MKKKLLSILIILALCLTLLPAAALAADADVTYYPVWIAGTQIASDSLSGDGWSFDPGTNTLTLVNASIDGGSYDGIYARGVDLTVVGTGSVTGVRGIWVATESGLGGSLTVSGDANAQAPTTVLTVTSTDSDDDAVHGDNAVSIKNSKVTVTDAGDDGISSGVGDIVIENSTLEITADYGTFCNEGNVIIIGSTVSVTDAYYGICSNGSVFISDGSTVSVSDSDYGIYAYYGGVDILDSTVTLDDCYYFGIYTYGGSLEEGDPAVSIADSTVTVTDCEGYGSDYGAIFAYYYDIVISDGSTVTVNQTDSDDYCYNGLCAYYGGIDILDSTVNISDCYYYGIYSYYDYYGYENEDYIAIAVKNSTVTLTDCDSCGIFAYEENGIEISDSTVTISDTEYGIWTYYDDLNIENSLVTIDDCYYYGLGTYSALNISGAKTVVDVDGDYSAIHAYEGVELGEGLEIVEPEGGFVDYCDDYYYTVLDPDYDEDPVPATHVVIRGPGEEEPVVVEPGYWVKIAGTANGSVTSSAEAAGEGVEITLTAKPDQGATLYEIKALDDAGRPVALTEAGDGVYTFVMPASDVRVRARFVKDLPFNDVDPDDYYYDAVEYLYDNKIALGTGDDTFDPDGICTRAETVTFLWRTLGEPEPASTECKFTDVDPEAYYYKAVLWAAENGITTGTSETTFEPDLKVQRCMTETLLYRTIQLQGGGFTGLWAFQLDAPDAEEVPEWAYESTCWMVMNGIVEGDEAGNLLPLAECTRGQIAAMIYRTVV